MTPLQTRAKDFIARHGSVRAAARILDVDVGYLHRLSTGERVQPSDETLKKLGLRRVVTFEPIERRLK